MTGGEPKARVARFSDEVFDEKRLDRLDAFITPDLPDQGTPLGTVKSRLRLALISLRGALAPPPAG